MRKSLFILLVVFIGALSATCNQTSRQEEDSGSKDTVTDSHAPLPAQSPIEITTSSGLKFAILKPGAGDTARAGQEVLIHETLRYQNDSLLFSSRKTGNPVKFLIGAHQAIDGVDEGVRGMQIGELRKLIVPPTLSRRTGKQTFPHPDSILVYEIELVDILDRK